MAFDLSGNYSLPLGFLIGKTSMPTVLRFGNLRVVIYPNDHRPAHVHIKGAKGEAVFMLHCPDGPPELRGSYGFKRSDLGSIEETLSDVLASLCAQWKEIHGDY
jgi:hypothetical protein